MNIDILDIFDLSVLSIWGGQWIAFPCLRIRFCALLAGFGRQKNKKPSRLTGLFV